jgi:Fic family protein
MTDICKWNWQQKEWPTFLYNPSALRELEDSFIHIAGSFLGAYKHIDNTDKTTLIIDMISDEALKTSEIEGEYLNRESLQYSIKCNLGLDKENRKIPLAEQGISEMMVDLYKNFATPLSNEILCKWHRMLMKGRNDLKNVGCYRTHEDSMQVISGPLHKPTVHFEAPPSGRMSKEMDQFIDWFNASAPNGKKPMPALARASISHLYFVSIHPFEDGNGRVGRAIAEKSLSQSIKHPILIALSQTIQNNRKAYYNHLEDNNKTSLIDGWVSYFANTILDAQSHSIELVEHIIKKAKFYDRFESNLNIRQDKMIQRLFKNGIYGFKGGLSAENYIRITGTSRATATRDLQDLVKKNALSKTGCGKGTRYYLVL